MDKSTKLIVVIFALAMIAAVIMAAIETKNYLNKISLKPTEVYSMANQHIDWD